MNTLKYFLPYYKEFLKLIKIKTPITYFEYLKCKIFKRKLYWYQQKNCIINHPRKIFVGINSNIGRPGNYIQGAGTVYVGNYVRVATNVGLLSSNHDLIDHNLSHEKPIKIGDYSWIGMNSIITAGVELGTRTIVGAGSVVTKSFPEGFCVIAGNPAKVIKLLDKDKFVPWHYEYEFYGIVPKEKFEKIKKKFIDI
jgi:acetyltransferase-like isoleucine patch superfamily enzyme